MSRIHTVYLPAVALFVISAVTLAGYVVTPTPTIDQWVLQSFVAMRTPGTTVVMEAVTWIFDPWRATVLAVALGVVTGWVTRQWRAGVYVTGSVAVAALITSGIKNLHDRLRPPEFLRLTVEHTYSFPSGHTTAAAAIGVSLAIVFILFSRKVTLVSRALVWIGAVALIVLIGVTRMYLGVHWLTDVLAGACVGSGAALILSPILLKRPVLTKMQRYASSENA
ncbi:phosphatase PAP2 family protein [Schaalia suimastitidis]|uniref:phosphatase PAP2 family protein n=1 Tax=Schaalia suimastitidis TaxID=121163 RepID=UPI0003FFE83F|nr:phosphatase PAP2 family protein [Schaalia suimastitidis]